MAAMLFFNIINLIFKIIYSPKSDCQLKVALEEVTDGVELLGLRPYSKTFWSAWSMRR